MKRWGSYLRAPAARFGYLTHMAQQHPKQYTHAAGRFAGPTACWVTDADQHDGTARSRRAARRTGAPRVLDRRYRFPSLRLELGVHRMSLPSSTALHTDTNELESGWLCGPVFPKPISFRVTHGGDRSLAQRCRADQFDHLRCSRGTIAGRINEQHLWPQ